MTVLSNFTLDKVYEELKKDEVNVETKYIFINKKTKNESKKMQLGRIWFNLLLPEDYSLIDEPINKSKCNNIIKNIFEKYGPEIGSKTVTIIQREAFKLATINPRTFDIDSVTPSDEWEEKRKKFLDTCDELSEEEFIKQSRKLTQELVDELEKKNIGLQDVLESGTKGGIEDWEALMVSKGFVIDIEGNISKIKESQNDGFSIDSYYKSGAQARRNYYVKSTMTAKPGYLVRKVAVANAKITITEKDCDSKAYLKKAIDGKNAHLFVDRYYLKGTKIVKVNTTDDIINKLISFRSPIYCQAKNGICEVCYGDLQKKADTKNVGILAAGAINLEAVNALMKMRHKSSQINIVDVDFIKILSQSSDDTKILNLILNISKNEIKAKQDLTVVLDLNDYDEKYLIDTGDKYILPGIIDIIIEDALNPINVTLPFNFKVDLIKPMEIEGEKNIIKLKYKKGDLIIFKDKYLKELDPNLIDRIFEGGAKYIKTPELLLKAMSEELTAIDSVHLECIVSNMFRSNFDTSVPGRLVGYHDCSINGCKKLPFMDSWLSSLAFENINKAIKTGLLAKKDIEVNPFEEIIFKQTRNIE